MRRERRGQPKRPWTAGSRSPKRFSFAEERAPCGDPGLRFHYWRWMLDRPQPVIDDVLVSRPRPHMLVLWEPLLTKTPGPHLAQAYCCYIRTVIFYYSGYVKRRWHKISRFNNRWFADRPGSYEEWDKVETRLGWDEIVIWQDERFEVGSGKVVWAKGCWWMRHWARRVQADRAAA